MSEDAVRIDRWLWAARFFKTRTLAREAIDAGRISINDVVISKSSKLVRPGDQLHIVKADDHYEIEVLEIADERGSASDAAELYSESEASIEARRAGREARRLERAGYEAPEGKPNKKARRLLMALGDFDAS